MDAEIKYVMNKVFTVEEARIVESMLEIVRKDMSESNSMKRINQIDSILMENAK